MMDTEKVVEVRVSRRFSEAFALVHEAFGSSPADIAEAKLQARAHMVAAEDHYYASAEMILAGWKPLKEQAVAFVKRTGYAPVMPEPEIQWPAKLKRAA